MPLNFGLTKTYDPVETTVSADQIEEYAAASGDANPAHQPGPDQVASAIFSVVPGFMLMGASGSDPDLGIDNPLMIVHGEQRFRYHQPLKPGMRVTMVPSIESVEDKGKHGMFVSKLAMTDDSGELVIEQWATIVVRGAGSGESRESSSKAAPVKGDVAATFTKEVDVDMPKRYAPASGDHNPIHLDDAVAKTVGLPGVINHGLGTLSLVSGGLVEQVAGGDVTRLRELSCRFTAMVFPGQTLTTTVWETVGNGAYLFETANPAGDVVVAGSLEVAAP
ncbi:MAG: MaoC family dehydratase N-terminal domain-containing protein [Acidimicrobiia bacterium]|nr:MaoC family dehydratase N-terminal domain-containing protein [Acidimicrobiia bacterium]MBT8214357.1 MaoC family dehydratase N-terminal domain-containing protein [Acidimicrobiia bacterium]NNF69010.1 dehydratase [Acidimicrobiia bacterium]NNK91447.1 dehydratase [Acidimicrobiia bacterium]